MTLFCCGFFYFYIFKYLGSIGSGEEVDFDVFAIFSNGSHLGYLT